MFLSQTIALGDVFLHYLEHDPALHTASIQLLPENSPTTNAPGRTASTLVMANGDSNK